MVVAVALAGCGDNGQNALDPNSGPSRDIATLWWGMLIAATVVFAGAAALLWVAYLRRARKGLPRLGEDDRTARGLVVGFGVAIPIVVLVALFAVANFTVIAKTQAPAAGSTRMTIQIIGHQWFWEVRYPGSKAVTANEIHIPSRTRVDVVATTADVIHSLWVPEINRKIDMIPGHRNHILFYADHDGVFRGQCAEYCGLQHAHMSMKVIAEPPARFAAWLRTMASPRRAPATPETQRGEQVFLANACASCHAIRGTPADGTIGPDLTHLATRGTLAALTIPNTRAALTRWIRDPQHIKPGSKMPHIDLGDRDLQAVVAYLQSLR
ncbi:c-type cytochrome [Baekduia soli]|uniref:Cytochrome aa3 subunit 2 n=1 Tax=Baekduia soli TaxID=496014 RepID=A0A5B8U520_9ACTN|nr:c-type cytochrome [Baekduia soli]QEC48216.1 c-type cytochrome [Baekduia soli]